jgi:uncharacterized phage protein (TIGR02218 family)
VKTLSTALAAHIAGGVTTMAYCWRVTRRDGIVLGFTEHDEDIICDGTLFRASSGFTASQIQSSLGLAVDNFTAQGALSSESITEADILAGRYDDAALDLLWVNWSDAAQFDLRASGNLGKIDRNGLAFTAEFRSLANRLNQKVGGVFARSCAASLGDRRCGVDLATLAYSAIGKVLAYDGGRHITVSGLERFAAAWFTQGEISISGDADVLIGGTGLIVNDLQHSTGRGNYFSDGSGTSEGQLLAIYAFLRAWKALRIADPATAQSFLARAEWMATALERTVYRQKIPPANANALFVPHWLFAARQPIEAQTVFLKYAASFASSGGHLVATIPANTTAFGDKALTVYSVYDETSHLLWNNPYSPVVGTSFPVLSTTTTSGGTTVAIAGSAAFSAYICYSVNVGGVIEVGDGYEAWPVWRALQAGEVDGAGDSFRWAMDMFATLADATGNPKWSSALTATISTTLKAMAVDDGRYWWSLSYSDDPYSLSGTYTYNPRAGVSWARDPETGILIGAIPADAGGAQAQIGRGVTDAIVATNTITVSVGADRPTKNVWLFVDTAASYGAATRYYAALTLSGAGRDALDVFTLPLSVFTRKDGDGAALSAATFPVSIYGSGFSDVEPAAHFLFVSTVRPLPQATLPYAPNVFPFTCNVLGGVIISWRGSPGSGYQAPDAWLSIGGAGAPVGAAGMCQFLRDAQTAYHATLGVWGPFAHCYVWDRADAASLGTAGTWVYTWYDPNSEWGGYQYRPLESTARFLARAAGNAAYSSALTLATSIVGDYFAWLDATGWPSLTGAVAGPPTNFTGAAAPTRSYEEPHFAALILRAAVYALISNSVTALPTATATHAANLAARAWSYLQAQWKASGALAGTWSPDSATWFGFWNAEIVSAVSLLLLEGAPVAASIGVHPATAKAWLKANDAFIASKTQPPGGKFEIKAHAVNPDGSAVLELWTAPGLPISVGDTVAVTAGCAKNFPTCKSKFGNVANFRGFPHIPGADVVTNIATRGDPTNTGGSRLGGG